MAPSRGISAADKQQRLLNFLQSTQEFYNLKDIEKHASKATGISSMQLKDVLQLLVDESLVKCEKIGSGNFYWSFKSDSRILLSISIEKLKLDIDKVNREINTFESRLEHEKGLRIDNSPRRTLLKEYQLVVLLEEQLSKRLDSFRVHDPRQLYEIENLIEKQKIDVNRWTDNIFALISFLKKEFFMDSSLIYHEFGISEDMDNV